MTGTSLQHIHGGSSKLLIMLKADWFIQLQPCQDPDAALLDSDWVPDIASTNMALTDHALEKAQGDDGEQQDESIRADSSSFKYLGFSFGAIYRGDVSDLFWGNPLVSQVVLPSVETECTLHGLVA